MASSSLTLEDVPDPEPGPGSVLIRVEAASLVSYFREYVNGRLPGYRPPPDPFTPGTNAIGVIEAIGSDVYGLQVGQRVLSTGYFIVPENVAEPAQALLSMTAGPEAAELLNRWPDGTFAELVVAPAPVVTPIPDGASSVSSARLSVVTRCLVPFGGFVRGRLAPGETVIVNGATGKFGGAAVRVALAMGAARVVAAGRNEQTLQTLASLERVVTVRLSGEVSEDAEALREAAGGGAELGLDLIGGATSTAATLATLEALGRGGRLVLMGSALAPMSLDYNQLMITNREIIGNFMYPASAPARLLALVKAGLLDLDEFELAEYPLPELPAAMDEAAVVGGPFVVLTPQVRQASERQ